MNNLCSSYTRFTTIIGIITFLTLAGCDNPARSDEHEHDHPDGLYLKYEGDLIFEYSGATLIERKHLLLQTGKEYRFEVVWIDEHGDPISKNHIDGEDHFLEWDIENEAVLEIQQQKGDVLFSFQLQALSKGNSNIQLKFMHGHEGHAHSHLATPSIEANDAITFEVE